MSATTPTPAELAARLPAGWEVVRTASGGWAAYLGGVARPQRGGVFAATPDELVTAVVYQASLVSDLACCPAARVRACVCYASFECPEHGIRCHGTHD